MRPGSFFCGCRLQPVWLALQLHQPVPVAVAQLADGVARIHALKLNHLMREAREGRRVGVSTTSGECSKVPMARCVM